MNRGRMSRARLWLSTTAFLILALAVGEGIHQLRLAAPAAGLEFITPGSSSPDDPTDAAITCRRRTSGDPTTPEGAVVALPDRPVRSSEVVNCPEVFDGHTIEYIGEVVGDVLRRDDGAWLLVNDDAYALESGPLPAHRDYHGTNTGLTVWVGTEIADVIEMTGGPGRRGDVFHFRGPILRVDPADGGGLTLRAREAELVSRGTDVPLRTHGAQTAVAIVAAAVALTTTIAERVRARVR
ncbi:MAG: hypothetical protein KY469_03090 [Actinobacteria bacterium]|nr:hypothetical protein [Actinomycetota bacterium]